jgi:hypothetical protein
MTDQSKDGTTDSPSLATPPAATGSATPALPATASPNPQDEAMRSTNASGSAAFATKSNPPSGAKTYSLVGLEFNAAKSVVEVYLNPWAAGVLLAAVIAYLLARRGWRRRLKSFVIEKAELGIGVGKITLTPNEADRQVAYQIWVELSTRKIGLPIDLQNDVVDEIYDSWHKFFTVTRELIKSVPVSRAADDSTRKIINLSIEVLNEGLRPHLTLWQARFRTWYDQQLKASTGAYVEPQDLQAKFPRFQDLSTDLMNVNQNLIAYRAAMRRIVYDD